MLDHPFAMLVPSIAEPTCRRGLLRRPGSAGIVAASAPPRKPFEVRRATIFQVQDGRVRRDADYFNVRTMLQQLGRMPATSSISTA